MALYDAGKEKNKQHKHQKTYTEEEDEGDEEGETRMYGGEGCKRERTISDERRR